MASSEATSTGYISREFPAALVVTKLDVVNEKSGHVCGDKTRCSQCDLRNNRGGFVATLTFFSLISSRVWLVMGLTRA